MSHSGTTTPPAARRVGAALAAVSVTLMMLGGCGSATPSAGGTPGISAGGTSGTAAPPSSSAQSCARTPLSVPAGKWAGTYTTPLAALLTGTTNGSGSGKVSGSISMTVPKVGAISGKFTFSGTFKDHGTASNGMSVSAIAYLQVKNPLIRGTVERPLLYGTYAMQGDVTVPAYGITRQFAGKQTGAWIYLTPKKVTCTSVTGTATALPFNFGGGNFNVNRYGIGTFSLGLVAYADAVLEPHRFFAGTRCQLAPV